MIVLTKSDAHKINEVLRKWSILLIGRKSAYLQSKDMLEIEQERNECRQIISDAISEAERKYSEADKL